MDRTKNMKRSCFKFSLKFVLLLPLVVAAYFALGPVTHSLGVRDVGGVLSKTGDEPRVVAPLLLKHSVISVHAPEMSRKTDYYVWLFGVVAKIPYTRHEYRAFPEPDEQNRRVMDWPGLPPVQIPHY